MTRGDVPNLSVEQTKVGSGRVMINIRCRGDYVAGLCFTKRLSKGELKYGYWVDFLKRADLSPDEIAEIAEIIKRETVKYHKETFGGA